MIEAMLAHDAQHDAAFARDINHLPCGFERCRDGLLNLDRLATRRARLHDLEPERRKGADVDEIHFGVAADVLVAFDELGAVLRGKTATLLLGDVRARTNGVADVLVGARVHPRNRTRAYHADAHAYLTAANSAGVQARVRPGVAARICCTVAGSIGEAVWPHARRT